MHNCPTHETLEPVVLSPRPGCLSGVRLVIIAAIPTSGSLLSKSLKNDVWKDFLYGKLADATGNAQTLEHRDLVAVVRAPLHNDNASRRLVEHIATLLALNILSI
jgi:hypothetical protein